jgi:hypothetical protein
VPCAVPHVDANPVLVTIGVPLEFEWLRRRADRMRETLRTTVSGHSVVFSSVIYAYQLPWEYTRDHTCERHRKK